MLDNVLLRCAARALKSEISLLDYRIIINVEL